MVRPNGQREIGFVVNLKAPCFGRGFLGAYAAAMVFWSEQTCGMENLLTGDSDDGLVKLKQD
jgi:hypothetical protein